MGKTGSQYSGSGRFATLVFDVKRSQSTNMSKGSFQSLDLTTATAALDHLFDQVLRSTGRIEITRGDGSEDACVLISLAELRSLEDALEILSGSESCRQMRGEILRIAGEVSPVAQPAVAATAASGAA